MKVAILEFLLNYLVSQERVVASKDIQSLSFRYIE
jgi:hypothetical protein